MNNATTGSRSFCGKIRLRLCDVLSDDKLLLVRIEMIRATITETDLQYINAIKLELADLALPEYTDFDYLRWLQGYNYNVDTILPKIRFHCRFMRSYDFSKIFHDTVTENYWERGILEKINEKDNNFVFIHASGSVDGDGIFKSKSFYNGIKSVLSLYETTALTMIRKREQETERQSGAIVIFDFENAVINATNIAMFTGPFRLYLGFLIDHYVEIFQKGIFVNTPSFIRFLWSLLRPVMPEKTKQKIVILGSNWKNEILNYINADALPVHWGGSLVDENGDPKYQSKVLIPTKVPTHMYWTKKDTDPSLDELTTLTVSAGRFEFVTVEVNEINVELTWYFFAQSNFGFGVFYTENVDEMDVEKMDMVYPQIRQMYGPIYHPETDKILCSKAGFYKLWYSNEFAWIAKLRVMYKIEIKN